MSIPQQYYSFHPPLPPTPQSSHSPYSNGYYVPSSASVSVGTTSFGPAHSSSGTVEDVLAILTKQMQSYTLPFDIWSDLLQNYVMSVPDSSKTIQYVVLYCDASILPPPHTHTRTHIYSHLIQRWVDYLTVALGSANRKALPLERLQPFIDGLTCQLLAFSKFFGSVWVASHG